MRSFLQELPKLRTRAGRSSMPRDKVALLINSCAKKPKPRRVTPSAPRPAQRDHEHGSSTTRSWRRSAGRVAFGDVSIHVFPMAIADNPAVRSGVALGLGREEVCCIVKSVDEHQPLRPRFYPRRPVPWIHPERRRDILAAEGITPEAIEASRKLVRAAQLERIKSLPPRCISSRSFRGSWPARYEESSGASGRNLESVRRTTSRR